jgi:hypothetical protein
LLAHVTCHHEGKALAVKLLPEDIDLDRNRIAFRRFEADRNGILQLLAGTVSVETTRNGRSVLDVELLADVGVKDLLVFATEEFARPLVAIHDLHALTPNEEKRVVRGIEKRAEPFVLCDLLLQLRVVALAERALAKAEEMPA